MDDQAPPAPKKRVRKSYPDKRTVSVEVSSKTYEQLREYCRLNKSQVRSEIDGLLQYAIEQRLKAPV